MNNVDVAQLTSVQSSAINRSIERLKDSVTKTNDPEKKAELLQSIKALQKVPILFTQDSAANTNQNASGRFITLDTSNHSDNFLTDAMPGTLIEYDQQQAKLLPEKRDGWLKHTISTRLIQINEKYRYNKKEFIEDLSEHFFHSLPTMMFVSLPIAAIIFQLVYIRRRKQFTYVQHGVFSIHIYIAVYIFMLVIYAFNSLHNITQWQLFSFLQTITIIGIFFYIYKAMRNFYEQGRWKTVLKFFIILFLYSIIMALLTIPFFMTSLIQV